MTRPGAHHFRALVAAAGLLVPMLPGACSSDDSTAEVSPGGVASVPDTPGVLLEVTIAGESEIVRIYGTDDGNGNIVITAVELPTPDGTLRLDVDDSAKTLLASLGSWRLELSWNAAGNVSQYQLSFGTVTAYSGGPVNAGELPDLGLPPSTSTTSVQSLGSDIVDCTANLRFLLFGPQRNDYYVSAFACVEKDPAIAQALVSLCAVRELLVAFQNDTRCDKKIFEKECKERLARARIELTGWAMLMGLAAQDSIRQIRTHYLQTGVCPEVTVPDSGTDAGDKPDAGADSSDDGGPGSLSACNALGDLSISAQLKNEDPGNYCTGDLVFTNNGSRNIDVLFFIDETRPTAPQNEKDAFWQISVGPGASVKTVTPAFSWQSGGFTITTTDVAAVYIEANDDSCLWIVTDLTEDEINDCGIPVQDVSGMNMCSGS